MEKSDDHERVQNEPDHATLLERIRHFQTHDDERLRCPRASCNENLAPELIEGSIYLLCPSCTYAQETIPARAAMDDGADDEPLTATAGT